MSLFKFTEADPDAVGEFVGTVLQNQAVQQNYGDCRIVRIYADSMLRRKFTHHLLDVQL
jgi:hypothetical protein